MLNNIPNNIYRMIYTFIFPINDINNIKIKDTINNILTISRYCDKCGENNKSKNCIYCNTILYYYCRSCMYCRGDSLLCCYESYKNNGMYHYNMN